jgi:acyl-CoA synthetase (AMP-forming)/AMP-acid ligase II
MATLGDIIERNALLFPQRPAILCGGLQRSHGEHRQRVARLARGLRARGLKPQDRFSVLAMNCPEFLELYAAAQWGGSIIHTVNFRLAAAEMSWMLQDAAPRLLVFEAQYAGLVESLRAALPGIETWVCIGAGAPAWALPYEDLFDPAGDAEGPQGGSQDYAALVYTSGTTGKPKGVLHTNHSLARIAEVLSSECRMGGDTRLLAIAPLFHAGASTLSWGAQFRGGCVVLQRGFDAEEVIRSIERERINAIHLVPTMVQALLDAPNFGRHDLSCLRMLMYAAAPMPLTVLKRAVEAFGPITYNGYGQTEINLITILQPHQHRLDGSAEELKRLASVGQPHWQSQVRILADDGRDCAAGEVGEVAAKSETAMAGYWNNTTATLTTIRDGWVHTGDLGYLDEQGYLFLVDRKKDLIISGGENIYSREVEEALAPHPAVREVAVIGVPHEKWGEAVAAIVALEPGRSAGAEELIAFSKTRIASYKAPKTIAFVEALPRLNTGKIDKLELRRRFAQPQS